MIYAPKTIEEAAALRAKLADSAVYLAGGTDDLRLGSEASGKDLIDINALCPDTIEKADGKIAIGSRCTLQAIRESELLPCFLREAAGFCASMIKRNSATVGGNLALRRSDSYLAAALAAAKATLVVVNKDGETKEVPVTKYLACDCTCLIVKIILADGLKGWVRRFGKTSSSHATLIAATCGDTYAISVSGSPLACGSSPDLTAQLTFCDDITGTAEYKKYLAETVFTLRR